VPFRLLQTSDSDTTPLYGRPFKCRMCDSREVTLYAIESQAEFAALQREMAGPSKPLRPHTTHPPPDPNRGLL